MGRGSRALDRVSGSETSRNIMILCSQYKIVHYLSHDIIEYCFVYMNIFKVFLLYGKILTSYQIKGYN